jgi:hypothetical protein
VGDQSPPAESHDPRSRTIAGIEEPQEPRPGRDEGHRRWGRAAEKIIAQMPDPDCSKEVDRDVCRGQKRLAEQGLRPNPLTSRHLSDRFSGRLFFLKFGQSLEKPRVPAQTAGLVLLTRQAIQKPDAGLEMKRCFSLASAAVLGLTLLAGTPSFGKGGHGHNGGGGGGHAHSSGGGHSGGHAHSSGHSSGGHHSSGHAAPSASTHPQMTHNSPTRPQTHSHPAHPQPAPNQAPAQHVAGVSGTSSQSFTQTGGGWHHGHHYGWGAWGDGVAFPWNYNPYWNVAPGVIVVPEETEIVEREYMTSVAATPSTPPAPTARTTPSSNADEAGPEQASRTP